MYIRLLVIVAMFDLPLARALAPGAIASMPSDLPKLRLE
jgi:hypothetical protein